MRRMAVLWLLVFLPMAFGPAVGECFEPGLGWSFGDWKLFTQPTHPRMSLNAAGVIEHLYSRIRLEAFAAGSRDEDRFVILPPASRTRTWHGYNPATGEGFWGTTTHIAPAAAQQHYDRALSVFAQRTEGSLDNDAEDESPFHLLGRTAHLVQDMTSVAHVHLDNHGLDPDHFPFLFDLDDFETYAAWAFASEDQVASDRAVVPDWSVSVWDLTAGLAALTYGVSAWPGELRPREDRPGQGEFGEMFPELTYIESGFWGDGVFRIGGVGDYDPDQSLIEVNSWYPTPETAVVERDGDGLAIRVEGQFYVQDAVEAAPRIFRTVAGEWEANPEGATLVELWGRELFPLAVGYTAALLLKFQEESGLAPPTNVPD